MGDQVVVLLINDSISAVLMVRDQTLDQIKQEAFNRWGSRMTAQSKVQIVVAHVNSIEEWKPNWMGGSYIVANGVAKVKE